MIAGHRNLQTIKGISFLGPSDEYVVSGSDDGHVYIWSKQDGKLQQWLKGDDSVINCLEPHPHLPCTMATSGEAGAQQGLRQILGMPSRGRAVMTAS